jgi:hypothetical protein
MIFERILVQKSFETKLMMEDLSLKWKSIEGIVQVEKY